MIRPVLLRAISAALQSHSYFSQDDFTTQEFTQLGKPGIEIKYRYDTTLFFRFVIPTTRTNNDEYIFSVTVRPGHESIEESLSTKRLSSGRLEADLHCQPVVKVQLHPVGTMRRWTLTMDCYTPRRLAGGTMPLRRKYTAIWP